MLVSTIYSQDAGGAAHSGRIEAVAVVGVKIVEDLSASKLALA